MVKVFKSNKGKEQVLKSYDQLLTLWDTHIKEVDLVTKYGTTHCIIGGNTKNPPLLMFHGVGDNSAVMWLLNMKELSRHFYCIAVDTLGGPGKSVPNEDFSTKDFDQIGWINEIAAILKISNFNIVGVSNGASIAYRYAVNECSKVNKVVCVEGGIITSPIKSMIITLLLLFPEILIPTKKNLIKSMSKLVSPKSNIFMKHPEVIEHMVQVIKVHNNRAMFGYKPEKYNKEKAQRVKEKLYFIIGDYMVATTKSRKEFVEILNDGGFKYDIIPNAGHAVNHEQAEIVNNKIVHFLLS
ncbi:pimeloyl-ACP methyl ester carboxylesterase [Anaerobacterium chartisolvens]|uniref:Pimeloyl-ACP methyl ester carboxylesterase n=1 Tax=Anaerobacterium chartisolvens TaxID=1297424 RepID=A0A369AF01_9FIRM|nr:alpha/beta hydrolase [Anaerobacterium chartisolvens]RCX06737.1 pimeloyl-ACP methyl ester carboxylesterase [Anaerobacterium chartisolvens]